MIRARSAISICVLPVSLFTFHVSPSFAANLASASVQVQDSAGAARTSFSSTERITLSMKVQNVVSGAGSIQFSFEVKDPQGSRRLYQTGNSAPGSVVGFTGASLRGIQVSQLYTGPGIYTLVGKATLGGETAEAQATFTVLNPVITLTYPPNGARDIIDQPLTFRWVSSGATRYKIFVDDDSSFYNALFTGESVASFFAYPINTSDVRQRLAGGQLYYWRVEGLDGSGNVIARTDVPFSFSVKAQATQASSKDLAVTGIEQVNDAIPGAQGALPIAVFVKNQGGRPESNVSVNLFADGAAAPTSPKKIMQIDSGKTEKLVFPVRSPDPGKYVVLNAVIDFFDDNLQNNSMSRQIAGEDVRRKMRPPEIWEIVKRSITDLTILSDLSGYSAVEAYVEGLNDAQLTELITAVKDHRAKVTGAKLKPVE